MRKKTNDQFLKDLKQINEKIIPEEPYINAITKIKCRCAECGYVWPVKPNNLLNGCGCPRCSGNLPFSHVDAAWNIIVQAAIQDAQKRNEEDFIKLLKKINPDILVSNYTLSDAIVQCKCKVCGNEWAPLASSLLSGHGCPKCAKAKNGRKRRLTNEEFVARLAEVHENIIPLEPYTKSDIKISCMCKVCGRTWSAKPANLLFGRGCRKCSRAHITLAQSKPVRCVETGVCYNSIAEVERLGIYNLAKCLKGRQETAGGYHWEYVEKSTEPSL